MTPTRLFHYQTFNEAHFISLLSEGKLKLSRPDKFNDPWDCRVHYLVPTDPAGRERVIERWKELHRKHYSRISEAKRAWMAYGFKSDPSALANGLANTESIFYKPSATNTVFIVFQKSLTRHSCGGTTPARTLAFVWNSTQVAHPLRGQGRSNTYPLIRLTTFSLTTTMNLFSPNRQIGFMKPSGG